MQKQNLKKFVFISAIFISSALYADATTSPPKIYDHYFSLGSAYYNDSGALVIHNKKRTIILGKDQFIGFGFNYLASKKNPVFVLKMILPEKVKSHALPGYSSNVIISKAGQVTYVYTKPVQSGLHNLQQAIRLTDGDPAGVWKFEFYIDGHLLKTAMINVVSS
ncbi:MAG: hypothetical protein OEZ39_16415 [Gammaproteobacteria bacterium]|nr:hypothetical protein [Gammaproteobacteria bacterium]MDH5653444.1 hypothetical protein [Gammaproteobacteria bacterium]